jgi:ABC-2 type transport system permease protein
MSAPSTAGRMSTVLGEVAKLAAFGRRDVLVAWSYRLPFITDWVGMFVQVIIFEFVGRLVRPELVPSFGGSRATYMEFVAVGIVFSSFTAVALARVYSVMRQEQLQGTLEALLVTPTSSTTIELGSVVYDLLFVPVRVLVFLALTTVFVGTDYHWVGLIGLLPILLLYIPFAWGLGILAAAWTITFKRGTGVVGLVTTFVTVTSGAFFPLAVLPGWLGSLAALNPLAIALRGAREALLGGASIGDVAPQALALAPFAVVSIVGGTIAFRAALARERRRGSLGQY